MSSWEERVQAALPEGWKAKWDDSFGVVHCWGIDKYDETIWITIKPGGEPACRWWSIGLTSEPLPGNSSRRGYSGRGFVEQMVRDAIKRAEGVLG